MLHGFLQDNFQDFQKKKNIIDSSNFREIGDISGGFRWVGRSPGAIETFS